MVLLVTYCYHIIKLRVSSTNKRTVMTRHRLLCTSYLLAVTLSASITETAAFSFHHHAKHTTRTTGTTSTGTTITRTISSTSLNMGILDFLGFGSSGSSGSDDPCVMGDESIMNPKQHGTSAVPVQENLRWNCDRKVADNICNFNR